MDGDEKGPAVSRIDPVHTNTLRGLGRYGHVPGEHLPDPLDHLGRLFRPQHHDGGFMPEPFRRYAQRSRIRPHDGHDRKVPEKDVEPGAVDARLEQGLKPAHLLDVFRVGVEGAHARRQVDS